MFCNHETGALQQCEVSVSKLVFFLILTYGHESWVIIKIILSTVQEEEIGFLWNIHNMTVHDNLSSCEICKAIYPPNG